MLNIEDIKKAFSFKIESKDPKSAARNAVLQTPHGKIETPIFMPVGTKGTVRAVHARELKDDIGAEIILGNTYHLYLRPGTETLEHAGGLHQFINWDKPILTDSGGYQVYSLAHRRKITEQGVRFASHIDGSYHLFSPEKSMEVQRTIGADIIMAFDECTPYPCEKEVAKSSLEMTLRWLKRGGEYLHKNQERYGFPQALFPIVQGGVFPDLRKHSAEETLKFDACGYAIGGLSVGEPHEDMYEMTNLVCSMLPQDRPRYLMGVGTPANILECIACGVDMFDCVMPTRNGRNGMIFTWNGIMNLKNKMWEKDFSPLDSHGKTFVDTEYSKAYLRHLFSVNEMLASQIASIHNLGFYVELVKTARRKIAEGNFAEWKHSVTTQLQTKISRQ